MSSQTDNMHLTKPDPTDPANIGVINTNMTTLDGHRHRGGTSGLAVEAVDSGQSLPSSPVDGQVFVRTSPPGMHFASGSQWYQLEGAGSSVSATRNLLVNGGFEVWQRGVGAFTTHGAYAADRWQLVLGTSTCSVSRITSTIGSQGYSGQLAYTHSGSGYAVLLQYVENFTEFRSKTVTWTATVKSTVSGTVTLGIFDGSTETYSSYNVGTGEQVLSVTRAMGSSITMLRVGIVLNVASCTVEVNDGMLVLGSSAQQYMPLTPAEEWDRCLRYYEDVGANGATQGIAAPIKFTSSKTGWGRLGYQVRKAVTPTISATASQWGVTNPADSWLAGFDSLGFSQVTRAHCALSWGYTSDVPGGAAGQANFMIAYYNAGAVIAVEANP